MKKFSLILIILCLCLIGCSNKSQEVYNSAINDGLSSVKEKKYGKAEAYFETALKEKKDDKDVKTYLDQTKEIQEVIKDISEGKIEEGLASIEKIEQIEVKLEPVQEEAKNYRKQLETAKTTLSKLTQEYEEAEKLVKSSDYQSANKLLIQMKEEKTKEVFYTEIMNKVTQLANIVTKKLEEQKAETEKKKQEEGVAKAKQEEEEAEKAKQEVEETAAVVPAQYIGYWGEKNSSASAFEITGTTYVDSFTGKSYKVTSVDQSGGMLTLVWDIQEYEQRNGSGSAGPGPQPFMFFIYPDGTLGSMSGKDTYSKM